MKEKTNKAMRQALVDASLAAARNSVLARLADKAGRRSAARLLRALGAADEAQARRILALARGKLDDLDAELQKLAVQRAEAAASSLPGWQADADSEGRATEAALFGQLASVAGNHVELLADPDQTPALLHVCQICGYVARAEPPANCPVCSAVPERFHKVE